eukprot:scaffold15517_cov114-Isochrysis_galbana.AAC.7
MCESHFCLNPPPPQALASSWLGRREERKACMGAGRVAGMLYASAALPAQAAGCMLGRPAFGHASCPAPRAPGSATKPVKTTRD